MIITPPPKSGHKAAIFLFQIAFFFHTIAPKNEEDRKPEGGERGRPWSREEEPSVTDARDIGIPASKSMVKIEL